MMTEKLYLVRTGCGRRLERGLELALQDLPAEELDAGQLAENGREKRLVFAVHVDEFGPDGAFLQLLRLLRQNPDCLRGSFGVIVVDGEGELYTKQAARELALAANLAGCAFPGKPLVEGTGSLYNQHILAAQLHKTWEETYFYQIRALILRLRSFALPTFDKPRLLMLHASDNLRSNTLWLGRRVLERLPERFERREIALQNGTIYDCRGCSYETCLHFAQSSTCFYGGAMSEQVLPAIAESDALLFLCPNYNDAVSANLTALFNRLTNLLVRQDLFNKYLFGIVVSGYSGSDLVAKQLLGAMCFNKTAILPPGFCLMQTAHDAGTASHAEGIGEKLDRFAENISRLLT